MKTVEHDIVNTGIGVREVASGDLEAALQDLYSEEPENHEHHTRVEDQVDALRSGMLADSVDSDGPRDQYNDVNDAPTLSEEEWAHLLHDEIEKQTQHVHQQLGNFLQRGEDDGSADIIDSLRGLRRYMQSPALDTGGVRRIARVLTDANNVIRERSVDALPAFYLESFPPETLAQLYREPADQDGWSFSKEVGRLRDMNLRTRIIEAVYKDKKDTDEYRADPLAKELDAQFDDEVRRRIALIPEMPKDNDMLSIATHNSLVTRQIWGILSDLKLPNDLIYHYSATAQLRLRADRGDAWVDAPGAVSGRKVQRELETIMNHTRLMTAGRLTELHKRLNVENLWTYNDAELETMSKLLDGDNETIQYMRDGDVTVEFIDARGDYNGALIRPRDSFIKNSGRTLRFEIRQPSDVYRRMAFLKRLGIKPSVLVYGAHGQPGSIPTGADTLLSYDDTAPGEQRLDRAGTDSEAEDAPRKTTIPIPKTAIGRLVRDYMQPNKNIYDTESENIGRIQVIIVSCSSDVPVEQDGHHYASMAEAVANRIADSNTDVYAPPGVAVVSRDKQRHLTFRILGGTEDDPSWSQRMSRLTTERRGGLLGYPTKIVTHRATIDSVSVGR